MLPAIHQENFNIPFKSAVELEETIMEAIQEGAVIKSIVLNGLGSFLTDSHIERLTRCCPHLEKLALIPTPPYVGLGEMTQAGFNSLAKFTKLQDLTINGVAHINFVFLKEMKTLQYLSLAYTSFSQKDLTFLPLDHLKEVHLEHTFVASYHLDIFPDDITFYVQPLFS